MAQQLTGTVGPRTIAEVRITAVTAETTVEMAETTVTTAETTVVTAAVVEVITAAETTELVTDGAIITLITTGVAKRIKLLRKYL